MKNLIAITLILCAISFTSCQDCKDCRSTSTLNLSIEYFTLDSNGTYIVSSTSSYSYSGPGPISSSSLPSDTNNLNLANASTLVLTQELCGEELKEFNNSTLSFDQIIGDTVNGLYKYTWSEDWDCQ